MKIKTKLLLVVILLSLFVNIITTTMYISDKRTDLLHLLHEKIENNDHLLNQVNSSPLYDVDISKIETNLKSFLNDPDIVSISIIENDSDINIKFEQNFFNPDTSIKKETSIKYNDEEIGIITTYYTTSNIDILLSKSILHIIISFILEIFLISLVLYVLFGRLTKPISNLIEVSSQIASGNLEHNINIKSNDEIGILSKSFEYMRKSLKDRINLINIQKEKIETFNKELQNEVVLQTKELNEQKEIFEKLFSESTDGVSLIQDGKFISCNNSVLKMLKYEKESEFLNLQPHQLSPEFQADNEKSFEKAEKLIACCIRDGHTMFEWIHTKSTGENFWVEVVLTRIQIHDEIIIHVVWRDISEKKILEEQIEKRNIDLQKTIVNLKNTQNKLVESEKMASLGGLVAGIAHEINTPVGIGLTGISHFLDITKNIKEKYNSNDMSQDVFEDYIDTSEELAIQINTNLQKTAQLVSSFKKISFDQSSEEKRKINVKEYVDEILFSMKMIIKKTNITIENNCSNDMKINTYPGAISQIITNLIINSIKHAFEENEKGTIIINATMEGNMVKLVYEDNGQGIEKETLPKIFDPFFTTNREGGGTGLGLNILYNIISTTLLGTIKCDSEKGNGVKFTILFQESKKEEKLEKVNAWQI